MAKKFRDYEIITNPYKLEDYLKGINQLTAVDSETTGLGRDDLLLGLSFYDNDRPPVYASTDYFFEGMSLGEMREVCNVYLPLITGMAHNAKFDLGVLKRLGFLDFILFCDTSMMCHVWDPDQLKKLETRVAIDLGIDKKTFEQIIGKKWGKIDWVADTASGLITLTGGKGMGKYACEDVFYTYRLFEHYADKFDDELWRVLLDIENPIVHILRDMNDRGVLIDVPALKEMEVTIGGGIKKLTQDIYSKAGIVFNLNSPKQKAEVLFDKLKLPQLKVTKTGGRSTDKYVLEDLADRGYAIAQDLVEYSSLQTLDSSFIRAIPRMLDTDGRLRCQFNSGGTTTGRFSSSAPNLQNQPNNEQYPVRAAFVPAPGYGLLGADYSQIELRMMAHCAQDRRLMDAFWAGEDIHGRVARDLHIPRKGAKVVNFGVLYGMGPDKLARTLDISTAEAKSIVSGYESTYRGYSRWKEATENFAERHKYIKTIFGRIRRLPDASNPRNRTAYFRALRQAVNTVIQGSAADLMKIAMNKVANAYQRENMDAHILLTVHDELLNEAQLGIIASAYDLLVYEMENAVKLTVPVVAEGKICTDWSQMKDELYLNPIEEHRFNVPLYINTILAA
jgi:DNA polymerase-1